MRNYSKRKNNKPSSIATTQKQFIQGLVFLICISLIIVFIFGDHGLFQLYKLKQERKQVQIHITQLRENREKLIAEKNRLENDLD